MSKTYQWRKVNSPKRRKSGGDWGIFLSFSVSSDKKGQEIKKDLEKILGINSVEPLDFPRKFDIIVLPLVKMCKGGGVHEPPEAGRYDV
ncbi:MAG: hypothetical protein HFG05_03185 [Oscillibacter sp.]|nr:hypothetical protein [Oscillibacter sp.]